MFYLAPILTLLIIACSRNNIEKGTTCLRLGDYPGAISFFGDELKRQPDSYEARLGLGKALLQQSADANGDTAVWKQGLMHIEAARTLSPPDDAAEIRKLLSEAWGHHARTLLSVGDTLGSLSALSRTIEYNPTSAEPLNLAGIIYFRLGDERKAIALFEKAAQIDKKNPSPHFNLGMIYWQNNRVIEAHAHWLMALKLSPKDEDLLYWFALAEKKMRDMENEQQ